MAGALGGLVWFVLKVIFFNVIHTYLKKINNKEVFKRKVMVSPLSQCSSSFLR